METLDHKIEAVAAEEKAAKLAAEQHEAAREAMITDIQNKAKKARDKENNTDDAMELDDMPGNQPSTLGNLLGFGGKRTKYVIFSLVRKELTDHNCRPTSSGGASGMFRKRNRG